MTICDDGDIVLLQEYIKITGLRVRISDQVLCNQPQVECYTITALTLVCSHNLAGRWPQPYRHNHNFVEISVNNDKPCYLTGTWHLVVCPTT